MAARIGLTGGIGSGKSTVLAMLQDLGAVAIDADAISRATTAAGGAAIPAIRAQFGPEFGRRRLTARACATRLSSPSAARAGADHPSAGGQEIARQVDAALRRGAASCNIPLLVESGRWRHQLDRAGGGLRTQWHGGGTQRAPDEVRAIIAAQAPRALRLAAADLVICNEGLSLEALQNEVEQAARSFGL
jgi:dephospho-CoA kinase